MIDQAVLQPIVLIINGMHGTQADIGNNNEFTEYIFGTRPHFVKLQIEGSALSPEDCMWDLQEVYPGKSLNDLRKWIDSEEFGAQAMCKVQKKLDKATGERVDPKTVRMIVVRPPNIAKTVLEALSSKFPNAVVCDPWAKKAATPDMAAVA